MITRQKVKKRFFFMLFLSIAFFFAAFLISTLIKRYYTPEKVTHRLNAEISSVTHELDQEIQQVASKISADSPQILNFLNANYKNAFTKKGIEILVYENDSLKYWTDNVFAAPIRKEFLNTEKGVVQSGSGYYLTRQKRIGEYSIVALQLIRYNYNYYNEYLPTGFFKRFTAPENAIINLNQGEYNVLAPSGKFLFSVSYEQPFEIALWIQYLIFTLYITSFLCLVSAIFTLYLFLMPFFARKWLLFLAFMLDVIIIRTVQFYFRFPIDLYDLQLFNPAFFASSELLPSLGDFLINSLLGVQLLFFASKQKLLWRGFSVKPNVYKKIFAIILIIFIGILYYFLNQVIAGLVLNSSISFRFENLLSLQHISHAGLISIVVILLGFFLLVGLSGRYLASVFDNTLVFIIVSASVFIIYSLFTYFTGSFDFTETVILFFLLTVLYFRVRNNSKTELAMGQMISFIILLSVLATYSLNNSETSREHEKRRLLATHLSDARDNLAEYYYSGAVKKIIQDSTINNILSSPLSDSSLNDLAIYIKDKYFSGYWNKYIVQVTVCHPGKRLNVKPGNIIAGCDEYFDDKITMYLRPVAVDDLYFLKQSIDAMYYLGKISLFTDSAGSKSRYSVFVEINSNEVWKGLGYPELLFDNKKSGFDNLSGYSYAFYIKGELVKNVGKYSYDTDNSKVRKIGVRNGYYNSNGYSHFIYNVDKNTMIVLSKELPRYSDLVAPFSYIFLLLLVMALIINKLKNSSLKWNIGIDTFRLRLQVIMISVIIVSSIILVAVSLLFINKLNSNKNNEILTEKLNSILVDLETRYGNITTVNVLPDDELSDLLINLSNTYFTDINIYTSEGFLLASSRDQIFMEGMISEQINSTAAVQLRVEKKSFFIQRENIGSYKFLSAYSPVRNFDNHLLGYLNLPYFAKQEEIRREISGLISAFANIYILMISITVLLALLLSRYITKPLQHIGNQFSIIRLGDKNARIIWTRKDEIGQLVNEYNRMIDEMERSAELLARSERESAWRQMARQVAHEIKNPLTPIKLSMQLLMKAWDDKAPDWESRLKRFSQTLIMQIDTLSSIATEFSDFAQMPEPQIQQFDVIPLIQQSAALFRGQSDCDITFETALKECIIQADPNQILRIFNNLIKNALQAIPAEKEGKIQIRIAVIDNQCEISFQDNGTGIANDKQPFIFSPNFTTKTAGMGLGLAMVKNIIDNYSGRIWFHTIPGEGTTFFIRLPLKDQEPV